jgi:hypothetical protein
MCAVFTSFFHPLASSVSIWTLPGLSAKEICGPDLAQSIVEIPFVQCAVCWLRPMLRSGSLPLHSGPYFLIQYVHLCLSVVVEVQVGTL